MCGSFPRRVVADNGYCFYILSFFTYFYYTTTLMLLDLSLWLCQNVNFNKCFVGLVKMKIHLGKQRTFSLCNYLVMSM